MKTPEKQKTGSHTVIELSQNHIAEAVEIHAHAIGYSLNALLGRKHLTDLYMLILNSDSAKSFVALDESSRVIGVVTGVFDVCAMRKKIFTIRIMIQMALRFIIHPKTWFLMSASVFQRSPKRPSEYSAALTSIAVVEEYRGSGVGRDLVCALERAFAFRGIDGYWLETRNANQGAYEFYRNLGFLKYSTGSHDLCLVKKKPCLT